MSRLQNKIQMGYFPTPLSLIDALASQLRAPAGQPFRWLDPCAGEGIALSMLAERLGGETFGIELDTERAAGAKARLQHVLEGDFADMRLPVNAPGISVLFLNPPYDSDDRAGHRLELHFLRETEDWLMAGGVLIYIIPQYRLSDSIARRLSSGYEQLRVYRFPDPEYTRFRQIVLFGVKRQSRREDKPSLLELLRAQTAALPTLPAICDAPYLIPAANGAPWFFRPFEVPPALVAEEAQRAGVFAGRAWTDLMDPRPLSHTRPLMPLRRGHVGTMAAAGALDNTEIAQGDTRLLIKGRLKKILIDCTDKADREAGVKRLVDRFEAQIVTLDLGSGATRIVSGEGDLREWLSAWMNELAAVIVEKFQPRHRMTYDDLPGFARLVGSHSRFRELPGRRATGLFESQKHVVAACLRRLLAPNDEALAAYLWQCVSTNKRPAARHAMRILQCGYWQARRRLRRALDGIGEYVIVQGEAGTGKTTIAASLAHSLKVLVARRRPFPVIVVCPPHLVEQWPAEITAIVPMAQACEVRNIRELAAYAQGFQRLEPGTLSVAVISSEMLKRGSGWTPAVVRLPRRLKKVDAKGRPVFGAVEEALLYYDQASSDTDKARWRAEAEKQLDQTEHALAQHDGEGWPAAVRRLIAEKARMDLFACPRCGNVIYEKDERGRQLIPITDVAYFDGRKLKCSALLKRRVKRVKPNGQVEWVETDQPCAEPFYQLWRGQFSREPVTDTPAYPLAEYIRRRMHHWVELAVFDELHLLKSQSSDRGHAFGTLAAAAKRTVGLTATLFGGMATSIFYLLYRLDADLRREFTWREGQRFAALYGILERIIKETDDAPADDVAIGAFTGLRRLQTRTKELPGVSPALAVRLLDHVVFLTLSDLGYALPPYDEIPVTIDMEPTQRRNYEQIDSTLLAVAKEDFSRMSEYLQTVLLYPDACWRDLHTSVQTWKALPCDRLYPKEQWLVETCKAEKAAGRTALVYVQFTDTKDIQPRLKQALSHAGIRAVVMPDIEPPRRMDWVRRKLKEGMDALIVNPLKVQTGLNLTGFQTIIYFEISYSLYVVHQASRRSWRLGQTEPVKVYYPVYRNAMEHRAVARVGQKLIAAQILYGNDIVGGLVSEASAGGGLLEELMRDVMSNTAIPDLSELFVRAERSAQEAGWLMGPDIRQAGAEQQSARTSDSAAVVPVRLPMGGVQSLLL
jgi:Uncharacterised methyltransferase family (DUF6094)